jgi:hypothetical protein
MPRTTRCCRNATVMYTWPEEEPDRKRGRVGWAASAGLLTCVVLARPSGEALLLGYSPDMTDQGSGGQRTLAQHLLRVGGRGRGRDSQHAAGLSCAMQHA